MKYDDYLKQMEKFSSTPEGKSMLQKMGLLSEVMPHVQKVYFEEGNEEDKLISRMAYLLLNGEEKSKDKQKENKKKVVRKTSYLLKDDKRIVEVLNFLKKHDIIKPFEEGYTWEKNKRLFAWFIYYMGSCFDKIFTTGDGNKKRFAITPFTEAFGLQESYNYILKEVNDIKREDKFKAPKPNKSRELIKKAVFEASKRLKNK